MGVNGHQSDLITWPILR